MPGVGGVDVVVVLTGSRALGWLLVGETKTDACNLDTRQWRLVIL